MRAVAVYCASSPDISPRYFEAADALARLLVARGLAVVNGGGRIGLMGCVNDATIDAGGCAIGVIPRFMHNRGFHHPALSQLIVTDDMHTRKSKMASLVCAAIALPGGVGTFEEILEIITWKKLGLFDGPAILLNIDGYYDPLVEMLQRARSEGFMRSDETLWLVARTPDEAVNMILNA